VWFVGALLVVLTVAMYLNGLRDAFVFDDIPSIVTNHSIEHLWPLSGPLSPPGGGETVTGRPMLNLSFALDYALGGRSPAIFRATNIAIHVLAGLLLFGLVRRTLLLPVCRERFGAAALPLAATIAGLWLLHPLQTAAVTYVVQRAESLMACFYLLTLYAFVRGTEATRPLGWFVLSWVACALGMATKEVMVSAPLIVRLYDWLLVEESWENVSRGRRWFHGALASTWLLLGWLVLRGGLTRGGSSGFLGVTAGQYWLTQPHAVFDYLRLTAWPNPLVFDHGFEWARAFADFQPQTLAVLALIGATVWAFRRGEPGAWLGMWFFAILAPTSIIAGARQTMADHRMYLALAPVLIFAVLALYRVTSQRALTWLAIAAAGFSALTVARNVDYRSVLSIWNDTVAKRPDNRWAQMNLGNALAEAGRPAEALPHYEVALRLKADDAIAHYDFGNALTQLHRMPEALAQFAEALRIDPDYDEARNNLADALYRSGRFEDAVTEYANILRRGTNTPEMHYHRGNALFHSGRMIEAVEELSTALRLRPAYPEASYNLGCIFMQTGQLELAARRFEETLQARPADSDAHNNLAHVLAQLGRLDEAIKHSRAAVRLNPANLPAHRSLVMFYSYLGLKAEAMGELEQILKFEPDNTEARQALEKLRAQP
jgi:protein O-mannosyl-transferase